MTRARQLKWAAQVDHVREATLAGTADAGAWSAYFESIAPGVSPAAQDGRCPVMIVAAEARFYGVQFREFRSLFQYRASRFVLVSSARLGFWRKHGAPFARLPGSSAPSFQPRTNML